MLEVIDFLLPCLQYSVSFNLLALFKKVIMEGSNETMINESKQLRVGVEGVSTLQTIVQRFNTVNIVSESASTSTLHGVVVKLFQVGIIHNLQQLGMFGNGVDEVIEILNVETRLLNNTWPKVFAITKIDAVEARRMQLRKWMEIDEWELKGLQRRDSKC
ncbi:hypothetical protein BDP27DRAFT_1365155 [Rhodocollybia butyracea]|uniref:Uncharacterized protein n=1 Tax=Rhodocollybia butyracea TaxID=206335 RepID=A0A9P5PPJ5_9AGAR|nr:hypothetical protein BDP27DRAFT_1365155 [Rhodocollybia butyracea]